MGSVNSCCELMSAKRETYSISELAKMFGLSRTTLLYYDRIGLLKPATRTAKGYRRYGERELARLKLIARYRALGIPIKSVARALKSGTRTPVRILEERLREVEQELAALEEHRGVLESMLQRVVSSPTTSKVDKRLWVEMLAAAGMDEKAMWRWHIEFERRTPIGHQKFLEGLGISASEVSTIRARSGAGITSGDSE